MVYFDQIMHHSAGNYQFAIQTFLLMPDTDQSTFTMCRAHNGQLILRYFRSEDSYRFRHLHSQVKVFDVHVM